jgi:hypothetical protein
MSVPETMLAMMLGPMAKWRLYKIAHLQSFAIRACLPYSNVPTAGHLSKSLNLSKVNLL